MVGGETMATITSLQLTRSETQTWSFLAVQLKVTSIFAGKLTLTKKNLAILTVRQFTRSKRRVRRMPSARMISMLN